MSAESGPDQPLRSQPEAPDVTIGFHTITLVIKVRAVQRPTVAAFVCGNTPSLKPRRMINCRGHTPMNLSTRPGSTRHDHADYKNERVTLCSWNRAQEAI